MITGGTVLRLIRRRIVLGIIFGLSLTYCAISLLAHEKIGSGGSFSSDNTILQDSGADTDDETGKNYPWPVLSDLALTDDANADQLGLSNSNDTDLPTNCRNSVQGKALIVDERGLVCARRDVLPTGCCKEDQQRESFDKPIIKTERYSCDTCNPQGCCAVYEYCVSCCLHPAKRRPKKESSPPSSNGAASRRDVQKSKKLEDAVKLRFRTLDRFQVCLAVCRTSSASVRHENTYKNPNSKHCYVTSPGNTGTPQRSERELTSINNKGENDAITSSSNATLFTFDHFLSDISPLYCNINELT